MQALADRSGPDPDKGRWLTVLAVVALVGAGLLAIAGIRAGGGDTAVLYADNVVASVVPSTVPPLVTTGPPDTDQQRTRNKPDQRTHTKCDHHHRTLSIRHAHTSAWLVPWNLTGQPPIIIPTGLDDDILPTAIQLTGQPDGTAALLGLAAQIESARPFPRWPVIQRSNS